MRSLVVIVLLLVTPVLARASSAPRWSDAELAGFAAFVVRGLVVDVASGLEPVSGQFYTYVTVDVTAQMKGDALPSRIVVKQLGGNIGAEGVHVPGQATFARGEDVVLFLEIRPRDRTLYTTAFDQGKWNGTDDDVARARVGVTVATSSGLHVPSDSRPVKTAPDDARFATSPYVLFSPPARWNEPAVFVDFQDSAQPGLGGGGFQEILNAFGQWNAAGGSIAFRGGGTRSSRCLNTYEADGRIVVTFDDPCGEVSNSGSTVGYAQYYWVSAGGQAVSGTSFRRIVQATVTTNDTTNARSFLSNSACFQSVMLHELGHTLGFDHTGDTTAIMYPTISSLCRTSGPRPLAADDIAALRFSYPAPAGSITPPSGAPSNVQVTVNGTSSLVVTWSAVTSDVPAGAPGAATSYRVDFRQSPGGAVLATATTTATSLTAAIPAGTAGTFIAQVTAQNSAGASAASPPVVFTIGGSAPGGCTSAPAAPTGVTGSLSGGVARVSWSASAGATSYVVRAGSSSGGANLFNGNVGASTSVSSPVAAGFRAFMRVVAVNACGESATSAEILIP